MFHFPLSWFVSRRLTSGRPTNRTQRAYRPKFFVDLLEDRTLLSAYLVNAAGDVGTGSGLTGDIRYAVTQANSDPGSTISFDTSGTGATISLTHGELPISQNVSINGPGAGALTISGAGSGSASRVFDITAAAATVTIDGLTITGGNGSATFSATPGTQGGDILNAGNLTLTNDVVSAGTTAGAAGGAARGGGIFNASGATLALTGTIVTGNAATGGAGVAGAAGVAGGVGGSALGGGVFSSGTLSISGATFTNNVVTGGNGGQGGDGIAGTTGATGTAGGNAGAGGAGGKSQGGGVYNSAGALVISGSTFSTNQVKSGSGGLGGAGGVGGQGTAGAGGDGGLGGTGGTIGTSQGGAVYNNGSDLTVTSSIFTSNSVKGGDGGDGGNAGVAGAGTTTAGSGKNGGTGGGFSNGPEATGGAIANLAGNLSVAGSSFTQNQVMGGAGGNGGAGGAGLNGGPGGSGAHGNTTWGGGIAASGITVNVTIADTEFTGNALVSGAGGNGGVGGASDTTSSTGGQGGPGGLSGSAWGGGVSYFRNTTTHTSTNTVSISGGSFTNNTGTSSSGGRGGDGGIGNIGGDGGQGANTRDTWGGGISVYDPKGPTDLVVSGTPITANALSDLPAGSGGAGGAGTTTGGQGGIGGRTYSPWGGGISVSRAFNVNITNSPVSNNTALGSVGGAGGAGGSAGAGGTGGRGGDGGQGYSAWGGGISIEPKSGGYNGSAGASSITNSPVTGNRILGSDGGAGGVGGVPSSGGTGGAGGVGGNGGSAWGGGILDTGGSLPSLTLVSSPVTQNILSTGHGGRGGDGASAGIGGAGGLGGYSYGAWGGGISIDNTTLTLDASPVSGNLSLVQSGGDGGNGGNGSTGAGGNGGAGGGSGSAYGGGISNDSSRNLQINASDITYNLITQSAGGAGGAGGAGATTGGNGGAGADAKNKVQGGGVFQYGGSLEIVSSAFGGNILTGGAGGTGGTGGAGGMGAGGSGGAGGAASSPMGGGVFDRASSSYALSIINSTFGGVSANPATPDRNRNILNAGAGGAGGAAGASGSGGAAGGSGGAGGSPQGGAIFVLNAIPTSLTNDTISGNQVNPGAGGAGGVATGSGVAGTNGAAGTGTGGGIFGSATGAYGIGNTIVALNTADTDPDVHGTFASTGHNLIGSVGAAAGFVASDKTTVSSAQLNLGPLQNNGGTTLTDALFGGSIAIDAGDNAILPLLPPPNNLILSTSATGGTLAAATYAYRVTAVNAQGETLPSPEVTITVGVGTTNSVTIVWPFVAGAANYKIYGRTAGSELLLASVGSAINTFIDDGSLTPAGALPSTNTASLTTDQRGNAFNRVVNTTIDVGAFETQALPLLVVSGALDGSALGYAPGSNGLYNTTPAASGQPFDPISADVRSAVGDVNGDGVPDLVFVTGPGVPILVDVVSGVDNKTLLVEPFDPFGGGFTGGGFVAAADFDRDGRAEFVVTPDRGGGPRVSIFSLSLAGTVTTRANYFTIDPNFRGGARAAAGDVNADGVPDLAVAAGYGGGPRIALINGTKALTTDGFNPADRLIGDFFAFDPTLRNGAYVAIGDVDGDGFGDMIFGAGPGGGPRVLTVSGKSLLSNGAVASIASPISNFFVNGTDSDRSGVRVAVVNVDNDSKADVAVSTGENQPSRVRVYLGKNFGGAEPSTFQDLNPYGGAALADGVFVG